MTEHPPRQRLSVTTKWVALVLLTLLGMVLLLGAAETAVRVRQYMRVGSTASYEDMYRVDPVTNLKWLRPGLRTTRFSVNSDGFRGPPIATPKPAGRLRFAYLGASTTFCGEVAGDEQVWPHIATERLKAAFPGRDIDFVNGGTPGYSVISSLDNLKQRVARLAPDVIVIYHATNDFSSETRDLAVASGMTSAADAGREGWLQRHSLLWELVVKNLRVRGAQQAATSAQSKLQVDPKRLGRGFDANLTALVREAKSVAKVVAVVTFATRLRPEQTAQEKAQAAVSALVYMPFMTPDGLIAGYARYNEVIREVAAREGVLLIDGENLIPGDAQHFADSVHFTDLGSAAQARRVADALAAAPAVKALTGTGR